MIWLALITTVVLCLLALVHVMWGFEVWWPIRDERRLVSMVVGFGDVRRMPGAVPCAVVSLCLSICCILIWWPQSSGRTVALWLAAVVFALRAALAYLPFWRRLASQQPFARLDQTVYAPGMAVLAVSLAFLAGWSV